MAKYTTSTEGDKKVEQDMKIICQEILEKIGRENVYSILLTGGFARGEGAIKIEKEKIFPYNDYDIQIISEKEIPKNEIDKISGEISEKLGYRGIGNFYPFKKENQKAKENFYLDLKCNTREDLKKMLPRIRTYELRNESKILYGEEKWGELRELIPNYRLENIPLSEGAKLLLDRLSQMIEYYSTEKKHENEFLTYIIQQAYTAICTSLLLLRKKHQIGYRKAMETFKENYKQDFPELYEKIPNLDKKIQEFVNWKLDEKKPKKKNIEEEWFICKESLLEVCKYFFSQFLNKKIDSIEQLSKAIASMKKEFYSPYISAMRKHKIRGMDFLDNFFGFILVPILFRYKYNQRLKELGIYFKTKSKSPDLQIFSSLIYIADSIKMENKVDEIRLGKGKERLSKIYPVKGNNWEEISTDYANAYIAFFLQKI